MVEQIHITRVAERFSSHTLASSPRSRRASAHTAAQRAKLIDAMVEVVAEGGDPRLGQSRALA